MEIDLLVDHERLVKQRQKQRDYYHRHHERERERCRIKRLKKSRRDNYGEGAVEHFEQCVVKQNGCCAICGKKKRLCFDHDHDTGKWREALCVSCNTRLGTLEDKHFLELATQYINKHKGQNNEQRINDSD